VPPQYNNNNNYYYYLRRIFTEDASFSSGMDSKAPEWWTGKDLEGRDRAVIDTVSRRVWWNRPNPLSIVQDWGSHSVAMKSRIFWGLAPWKSVKANRRFGGTSHFEATRQAEHCYPHIQAGLHCGVSQKTEAFTFCSLSSSQTIHCTASDIHSLVK
jgi:hypothetical protein